ncbi:MAG: hypothetical protein JO197_03825 [Acidobacteria bacterium]|nr:hypothetical protein [Acidobacteriota bacterium]MBV9476485.1 hypothetical protein [Acidobacteriota bacterium]
MALIAYLMLLAGCTAYASLDWRRGWYLLLACGVLQDPVRKLTPGTPVTISFSIILIYAMILFTARKEMAAALTDFSRRFANLYSATFILILTLAIAAMNGLVTYGVDNWKVPMLGLFTYLAPLPAIILGYTWLQREEQLYQLYRVYAAITSIALIGTILEYFRVRSPVLGLVAQPGVDYIRYFSGMEVRLLSGFYRSPDIMGWHAATLTAIAITMALRSGVRKQVLIWMSVSAWAFLTCLIAGRRKATYFVVVYAAVVLWRYFRRVQNAQVFSLAGVMLILWTVMHHIAAGQQSSAYARAAAASQDEITHRLEGGAWATFQQYGFLGAGLGTATQGAQHVLKGSTEQLGWQEGGLGKLAIEVGLPGLLAIAFVAWLLLAMLMRLTKIPDVPGSSQLGRVSLFGLFLANAATFTASAQAYTDAVLSLFTAFLIGCLFATAALDERLPAAEKSDAAQPQQLTAPATA